jgi:predicted Zn-dependent protease
MRAAASAKVVMPAEMHAFEQSKWAVAFFLWKSLDPKHHEEVPDIAAAMALIEEEAATSGAKLDEIMANVSVIQQDTDLKNSAGRTATAAPATSPATDTRCSTDGPPSTSTSQTASAGRRKR